MDQRRLRLVAGWIAIAIAPAAIWAGDGWRDASDHAGYWGGYSLMQHQQFESKLQGRAGGHGHGHHGHGHHGHGHSHVLHACPVCGLFGCTLHYGLWNSGTSAVFVLPPLHVSPWQMGFGPAGVNPRAFAAAARAAAVNRPRLGAPRPAGHLAAAGIDDLQDDADRRGADAVVRRAAKLRRGTEAGRGRADRLLASGDALFRRGEYARAAGKYRSAIPAAPDHPRTYFRLGHASIATQDYESALDAFLLALELAGTPLHPGFSLDELYGPAAVDKTVHEEWLSDAALRAAENGGLLMLVGLWLHYDGEPLRARPFFQSAAAIAGPWQPYAAMYLPPAAAAEL